MKPITAGSATYQLSCLVVLFTLLTIFSILLTPTGHHGSSIVLPRANFTTPQEEAQFDRALMAAISHDGKVFFGSDQIDPDALTGHLRASHAGSSSTLFVPADARSRYGQVKVVIDAAHSAGIQNVVFLTR